MRGLLRQGVSGPFIPALLLSLVLLVRIAAPVGFMPVATSGAITIQICGDADHGGTITLDRSVPGDANHGDKHDAADTPCAFAAGLVASGVPASAPVSPHWVLAVAAPLVGALFAGLVCRLAAPPPPAIGPPAR